MKIGDIFWDNKKGKGTLTKIEGVGDYALGLITWEHADSSREYLCELSWLCEVYVDEKWVRYDMSGDITPESKAWHADFNIPLVIIAEGTYPVRFKGRINKTDTQCFYQKTTRKLG